MLNGHAQASPSLTCNLGLLTKFTPGQSISLTGRVRDDRQDNGRLDIPSEFPSKPEPQKIRHSQPSRLLGVNPPTKDHKDAIVSRGTATDACRASHATGLETETSIRH